MKIIKNQIVFAISCAVFIMISVWITGSLNYFLPQPMHFFGAMVLTTVAIFVTMKLTDMTGWQFISMGLGCLIFSLFSGQQVKKYLETSLASRHHDIRVEEYEDTMDVVSFTDHRLAVDSVLSDKVVIGGTHHYFVVPIISDTPSDSTIRLWAWTRKMNTRNVNFSDLHLSQCGADFGTVLKDNETQKILEKIIKKGARDSSWVVDSDPIIFSWGQSPKPRRYLKQLYSDYVYALGMMIGVSVLGIFLKRRKKEST